MIDFSEIIVHQTDWVQLSKAVMGRGPLVKSMCAKFDVSGHGVYQLAHKDDIQNVKGIVDGNIGYTGMSANIFARVSGLKTGKHDAGKMLLRQNLKPEDVMIRYLFTKEGNERLLETSIHTETNHQFGHNYKWTEASGGNDGRTTRIIIELDKVENLSELVNIIRKAEERWAYVTLQAAKDGTLRDLVNDYFSEEGEE